MEKLEMIIALICVLWGLLNIHYLRSSIRYPMTLKSFLVQVRNFATAASRQALRNSFRYETGIDVAAASPHFL